MRLVRLIIILAMGVLIGGGAVWAWNTYQPRLVITPTGAPSVAPTVPTGSAGVLEEVAVTPAATRSASPTAAATIDPQRPMSASLESDADAGFTQSGGASLVEENGKVRVTLLLNKVEELNGPQPSFIQLGTCRDTGAVLYPLSDVDEGKSETLLTTTLSQIRRQSPLVVVVFKSERESDIVASCGALE